MKIAVAQLNSSDDTLLNLRSVKTIVESVRQEEPEIIFFPENTLYFRIDPAESVQPLPLDSAEMGELKKVCQRNSLAVHFTTAIEDRGKIYNASVLVTKDANIEITYRKIHLFDIALIGQKPIRESDVFTHGSEPRVFEFGGYKFGSSICYDLRFAELFAKYARQSVDVMLVPSAFLVKTGLAHWEVLLRARAIESQCYVVASAQSGVHVSTRNQLSRETFGHSAVINPWGKIVAERAEGVGVIYCTLDREEILSARRQIPMRDHRRIDF